MRVSELLVMLKGQDPKASVWIKSGGSMSSYIGVTTDVKVTADTESGFKPAVIFGEPLSCCELNGNDCCGYVEDLDDSQGT